MPWLETEPMNEKIKFIAVYLSNQYESFSALCQRFNISCKTGYKYVQRYKEENADGLKERSRAPHHHPNQIPNLVADNILAVKYRYPSWGAKKIQSFLQQEYADNQWPAKSTIDDLLKKNGLVRPAKRKRRTPAYTEPFVLCTKPNDVWSIDYKGQFKLGNRQCCYPLTITDNFSRYIFAIDAFEKISAEKTKQKLWRLFEEYGLPAAIRSDNGTPFAGNGLGGLSCLSVLFIKLGIVPERIRKGHPEENGRHERMHLTLKRETASPPRFTQIEQQNCFDAFKKVFNEERPHEGINFERPSRLYQSSGRRLPKRLEKVEYDNHFIHTRQVRTNGTMKWKGKEIFISETLTGEAIGMKPYNEEEWIIYFSFLPIGIFNEEVLRVRKI